VQIPLNIPYVTAAPAQTERGTSGRHRRDGHRFWPRVQRALVIGALCAVLPLAAIGQNQLPDFGDSASATLSPADEREIGAYIMRQIRAQLPVVNDPEIEAYIQSLGYSLVSGASEGTTDFHFFVIADPTVNAFALPGGYIGVHSGLITSTDSESELASVMAHEIAHVTQRHIARAIAAAEGTQYATLLAVIAGLLIGTQNSQAGQATIAGATAAGAQTQINFTRTNEKEADRVGIGMLAKAGYDPRAMPTFFEKLGTASRYYSRPPEFLSTHPVTTSRIADSRGRAEQYPYKQFTDSISYGLTRAKLRVLTTNNPARLLATYEAELKEEKTGNRSPALYGRALVLAKLGKTERASEELRKLIAAHPERVRFRVALAKQQFVSGNTEQALATYHDAYGLFPDSKQVVRGYVDALLRTNKAERALVMLDDYSRLYAKDAALYRLEAEAFRLTGKVMNSRMALAEYYYQTGELDGAIHQLQLASNEPDGDFYQSSKLDARLKELKAERDFLMRR
jgi:predicted Zn-dependent protease